MNEKPWLSEPDRLEWEHAGLKCLILRMPGGGHLCGYVGVKQRHPAYNTPHSDETLYFVDVHGGLTFGEIGDGRRYPAGYYWLGFDCAHSGDLSPFWHEKYGMRSFSGVYRDITYVKAQTESLARQLASMTTLAYCVKRFIARASRAWKVLTGREA